ncbi:hypothetical protein [Natrialbaceae archaeon AArc-T1-2]|uniref:hypothetical protein n=1 Tax=Natrialbaceae archaeon AArc-T1-2 TaxID=3053904 RepID=UPI00255AB249|nr:hypothetical protein [Natrialbaceae archaeon AArc-T1-2]WIV67872.1 hypothetical protein QQ977_03835 [Natrialbaceae archaeon AArc-T1-2]
MSDKSQQDERLSERVVKEAVGKGMESPMRDSIVEAVEESDAERASRRRLPVVGAVLGLGAAVGYLVGTRRSGELEERSVDEETPEIIEDVPEELSDEESADEHADVDVGEEPTEGGGSRLRRLLVALGIVGAIVLLRRRLRSSEEDEWEPIDEFEPAVGIEDEGPSTTDAESDDEEESLEGAATGDDESEE